MLKGRLGLDDSRIMQKFRHPFIYLHRGGLSARDGGLIFSSGESETTIPVQSISAIMIGPGSSVTHDALRLMSAYDTCLVATGVDGVRCYTAPAITTARSGLARIHAVLWADEARRITVARRMYAIRFGELLPKGDLDFLRGVEGARVKTQYRIIAQRFGISWCGRHYDRLRPEASDDANAALNHASSAVEAAACIAVTAIGAIPQLGFIHEDPGQSLILDVADLFRESVTIPSAFEGAKSKSRFGDDLERSVRNTTAKNMKRLNTIESMMNVTKAIIQEGEIPKGSGLSEAWIS